jgi:hypothetical protein
MQRPWRRHIEYLPADQFHAPLVFAVEETLGQHAVVFFDAYVECCAHRSMTKGEMLRYSRYRLSHYYSLSAPLTPIADFTGGCAVMNRRICRVRKSRWALDMPGPIRYKL